MTFNLQKKTTVGLKSLSRRYVSLIVSAMTRNRIIGSHAVSRLKYITKIDF